MSEKELMKKLEIYAREYRRIVEAICSYRDTGFSIPNDNLWALKRICQQTTEAIEKLREMFKE